MAEKIYVVKFPEGFTAGDTAFEAAIQEYFGIGDVVEVQELPESDRAYSDILYLFTAGPVT